MTAHIKDGKLRGLAIADNKRSQSLPGVPTLEEAGTPHHEVGYWTGILVPAGTPSDIVNLLSRHVARIVSLRRSTNACRRSVSVRSRVRPKSSPLTSRRNSAEWGRVVREAKIRIELDGRGQAYAREGRAWTHLAWRFVPRLTRASVADTAKRD